MLGGIVLAAVGLAGCGGSCPRACEKLMDTCGLDLGTYTQAQCEAECTAIEDEYNTYDYLATHAEVFQEELDCIDDATCEELLDPDAPACYAEYDGLYVFY